MDIHGRMADLSPTEAELMGCRQVLPVSEIPIDQAVQEKREQESEVPTFPINPIGFIMGAPLAVQGIRAAWRRHKVERLQQQINAYKYKSRGR